MKAPADSAAPGLRANNGEDLLCFTFRGGGSTRGSRGSRRPGKPGVRPSFWVFDLTPLHDYPLADWSRTGVYDPSTWVSQAGRLSNRYSFATDLYERRGEIRLVQKALGHSHLSTTMIYTYVYDEGVGEVLRGFRSIGHETAAHSRETVRPAIRSFIS